MSWKPNPNMISELQRNPQVRQGLREMAEELRDTVEPNAKAIMPRKGHRLVEVVEQGDTVYVSMTAHGAHLDEFGSRNNPPYAPMRTGISALGLRLEADPKS